MRKIYLAVTLLFSLPALSQQFISQGRITYERRVNQWANIQGELAEQFRKSLPQYRTDLFSLSLAGDQSLYQPVTEVKKNFFNAPGADNIVYSNFSEDTYIAKKNIFEKTFLIRDSVPKIQWKIKDDFREIAGFNCRRATAILFDSVFVVAFYTDEITLPGGPEGFNGLPGTILGLVINRLHTTWYATKVEIEDKDKIIPPTKGTPVSQAEVIQQLRKSLSTWGAEAQRIQWAVRI